MTYGIGTHSFLNSTEHRQMKAEQKEATDQHLVRCRCGKPAVHRCAWKIKPWARYAHQRLTGRCERPMCEHCAIPIQDGKFVCWDHEQHYNEWLRKQQGNLFSEVA